MKRWRTGIGLALLLALLGAAGGVFWRLSSPPDRFLVVTPGVLYRSGQLTPERLEAVLERYAIRTVVNLRSPEGEGSAEWHRREAEVCSRRGVELVDLPMEDDRPPAPERVAAWLELFETPGRLPILVHCKHGVVRTGMMVGIYEIERLGRDPRRVLDELPAFGHDLGAPENRFFRDLILGYTPRRSLPVPPAGPLPAPPPSAVP